jgi:hypothetical protein
MTGNLYMESCCDCVLVRVERKRKNIVLIELGKHFRIFFLQDIGSRLYLFRNNYDSRLIVGFYL